jgi:hypothetical protein
VEPDDHVEEGRGNRRCGVRVAEGDEVGVFRKSVHHRQDDRFAADLGKTFHEIERNVAPYAKWYRQWLQEAGRVKLASLVPLAYCTAADEVMDQAVVAWREERGAELLQSFLPALMAHAMGLFEHQWPGRRWEEEVAAPDHQIIHHYPLWACRASINLGALCYHFWQGCYFHMKFIN